MTTAVGGPFGILQLGHGQAQHQAVDHRHALERPVGRGGGDAAVGLGAAGGGMLEQRAHVRVGRHGEAVDNRHGVLPLELGLVEEGERPFPLLVAGGVVGHAGR